MTKVEEIYEAVLPELASHGIEDTTQNRLWALEGLRDAWNEDSESSFEKSMWQLALMGEIWSLESRLRFGTLFEKEGA
jgi:hypothetical protein